MHTFVRPGPIQGVLGDAGKPELFSHPLIAAPLVKEVEAKPVFPGFEQARIPAARTIEVLAHVAHHGPLVEVRGIHWVKYPRIRGPITRLMDTGRCRQSRLIRAHRVSSPETFRTGRAWSGMVYQNS
jgi:hypothetical protein